MAIWTPYPPETDLWLDGADTSTITLSGSDVTQWAEKSNNGHLFAPTNTNEPTSGLTTLNGHNVVDFAGSGNHLKCATSAYSQPMTYYIVGRSSTVGRFIDGISGTARHAVSMDSDQGIYMYAGGTSFGGGTGLYDSDIIICAVFSSTTSKLYINGVLVGTGSPGGDSVAGLMIGDEYDFGRAITGYVAEIIGKAGVPTTYEQEKFEGYLAHKWGLDGNLAGTHTYAVTAPQADEITLTLPSFDFSMFTGAELGFALPSLSFDVEGRFTEVDIAFALPALDFAMHGGAEMDFALPSLSFTAEISHVRTADINFGLPSLGFSLEANTPNYSEVAFALPSLGFEFGLTSVPGADIAFALPSLDFSFEAERRDNSISFSIPSLGFTAEITAEAVSFADLRYIRGRFA